MILQELKANGINVEDLTYPYGEMNIIVQCFGKSEEDHKEDPNVYPSIFQPRKNTVISHAMSGEGIDLSNKEEREDYVKHLKDSVGRLRIMALLLEKQAKEIEKNGYCSTTCYYPDIETVYSKNDFTPEVGEEILVSNDEITWQRAEFNGFTNGQFFGRPTDATVIVNPSKSWSIKYPETTLFLYKYFKKFEE